MKRIVFLALAVMVLTPAANAAGGTDREFWAQQAARMAEPVLRNMAEGKLHERMLVETGPTWDGRDINVTYMECFGRLIDGIAPWLALPDDGTPEGAKRAELLELARRSAAQAVDPGSPDYLLWRSEGQPLVDAAFLAEGFLRAYDSLWMPLDDLTKQRYIEEFTQLRRIDPPYSNWLLFSSTIEAFLAKAGAPYDLYRINSAIRKVEEWYVGDGWYSDGQDFAFNYYTSFVFHSMYLDTLQALIDAGVRSRIDYREYYERALTRAQRFSVILERMVSPEGTFPAFGRSITYRTGVMHTLSHVALLDKLPAELPCGQARAALTAVLHKAFDGEQNYNEKGYLRLGFNGSQPGISDSYTNNGSLYLASFIFLPLGLAPDHPFWTSAPLSWTNLKAWSGEEFLKDHSWR